MPLYGPKWPLKRGERDTFELIDNVESQVNYYLKSLLLTSPGENLSDFDYGIGIRRFIFEQNTAGNRSSLESKIRSQVRIYLPYIKILEISVLASEPDVDNNSARIRIVYNLPRNINQIIFELDISNETTIGFY
jgi:phage baseplate assembly protein W